MSEAIIQAEADLGLEVEHYPDEALGHVPLSKPVKETVGPKPFPARALRYGPAQAPILERD